MLGVVLNGCGITTAWAVDGQLSWLYTPPLRCSIFRREPFKVLPDGDSQPQNHLDEGIMFILEIQ